MRALAFLSVLLFSNITSAVGWEEIAKENAQEKGIYVKSEFSQKLDCFMIDATVPSQLHFKDLGIKDFEEATYRVVPEKNKGWQLTSDGMQISLYSTSDKTNIKIEALCLSETTLAQAYLSLLYGGAQGSVPMVVLLNLGNYK